MGDQLVRQPGFLDGAASIFKAFAFLRKNPETWAPSLVPALLFAALASAGTFAGVVWLTPWLLSSIGHAESWYATAGMWVARVLLYVLSSIVGVWAALLITPPLSAPALEHLIAQQEAELGVVKRGGLGFFVEMWCGLKAQVLAVAFTTPILVLLWVLDLFVPPLSVVTVPLKVLVAAMALAWNLFDYPMTLWGVPINSRLSFVSMHLKALMGFGLAFAALFWIPCFGVLMLPVGVVASTRLLWQLAQANPAELPELPKEPLLSQASSPVDEA